MKRLSCALVVFVVVDAGASMASCSFIELIWAANCEAKICEAVNKSAESSAGEPSLCLRRLGRGSVTTIPKIGPGGR